MSGDLHVFLANIWFCLLGLMLVLYVIMDGFDLGVGILSLLETDARRREQMILSIHAIWDANETWLVLFGGALFGAFPVVYALALQALYIPISVMLFGLILRGIAFELYRHARHRLSWYLAFSFGSLLVALSQGFALGGLISGMPIVYNEFTGDIWFWLNPFAGIVALGVVAGYSVLGGTYLLIKTRGEVQAINRRRSLYIAWIMLFAAAVVTMATPFIQDYILEYWLRDYHMFYLLPLPVLALFAFFKLQQSLRSENEYAPFIWGLVIFVTSFAGLALSLYPYLIPGVVTIADAASSTATQLFMLVGIGMFIPVILVYNTYQYLVFRGKTISSVPTQH